MDKKDLYKVLASLGVIGAGYYGYKKVMGDKPNRRTSLDDFGREQSPRSSGGYYYAQEFEEESQPQNSSGGYYYSHEFWGEPQTQERGPIYSIDQISLVDLDLIRKILNKPPKELSRNQGGLINEQQAKDLNNGLHGGFVSGGHTDKVFSIPKWRRISIASLDDISSEFHDNALEIQAVTSSAVRELLLQDPQALNRYANPIKRINAGVMYVVRDDSRGLPVEYRLIEIGDFTIKDSIKIFNMIFNSLNS